ncbi:MAG: chemotaxis protein CheD [Rhodobacterales bacterium]|nr:chemotaxis protein CheD [Rhodobacterales bacterium]
MSQELRQIQRNNMVNITQGEFAVGDRPESIISTVLGSCVSVCLWDPKVGIGGMNHILVAQMGTGVVGCDSAGVNAMELVINAIVKMGASRSNLHSKIFGGAKMIAGLSDVGRKNAVFAEEFLASEGIPCVGKSTGGIAARQIRFYPYGGKVLQKTVKVDLEEEKRLLQPKPKLDTGNDMEFF